MPYVDAAWVCFGSFSRWHPSVRTGRVQPAARERCDRNSKHPDCLQGRRHSTLRCGLCGRGHLSYPSAASRYCQKHAKSVGSHRHHAPDFHVFSGPIYASGFPHSSGALHVNNPHTSARLSPCAGAVPPYVFAATPYSHQAPKTQLQFQRDQRFRPRKPGTRRPPRIPCVACRRGTACPGGASNPPRPARPVHSNLRARPAYSNSLRQRRGGHGRQGMASLRDATTPTTVGPAPACVIGPEGPMDDPPEG